MNGLFFECKIMDSEIIFRITKRHNFSRKNRLGGTGNARRAGLAAVFGKSTHKRACGWALHKLPFLLSVLIGVIRG